MMNGGQRKFHGLPTTGRKERDEDLLLFREIHKREKDRIVSLLQPVPDEFEASGHYPLYKMASVKKGAGYEFLGDSGKTDYNWLKTPPATPLFQSLEMEAANAPQLPVQRELPIFQPLSRFAGKSVTTKESSERSTSPNPKQKAPPRSVTPSQRPSVSAAPETKPTSKSKQMMFNNHKMNESMISNTSRRANAAPTIPKPAVINAKQKEGPQKFLAVNLSKSMGPLDSVTKQTSRGVVSHLVRPKTPSQIPGFTDEPPPSKLRTDRSSSASRFRIPNRSSLLPGANVDVLQKTESIPKTMRRPSSSSPSGTKVEIIKQESIKSNNNVEITTGSHEITNKLGRTQLAGGNGVQILGSRMVDRFMNARKSSAEERETKLKFRGSINESSGFGRMIMSKSSLDVKRDPAGASNFHRPTSTPRGRYANGTIKTTPTSSSTSKQA